MFLLSYYRFENPHVLSARVYGKVCAKLRKRRRIRELAVFWPKSRPHLSHDIGTELPEWCERKRRKVNDPIRGRTGFQLP